MPEYITSKTHMGEDKIGYIHEQGEGDGYFFLNGRETAIADEMPLPSVLYELWGEHDITCTFFDYGGWGMSGDDKGKFQLARWLQNSLDVFDATTHKKGGRVLVGYSLGVYLALAIATLRPKQVSGIVGFAPSLAAYLKETKRDFIPDTSDTPLIKVTLDKNNVVKLAEPLNLNIPIRLLHGTDDKMANYHNSLDLMEKLTSKDINVQLIKGGTHFFKHEEDLEAVCSIFV